MQIETAEVVSPYTVNQHLDAVGILPNNAQNKPSFSEVVNKVISTSKSVVFIHPLVKNAQRMNEDNGYLN